MTVSVAIHRAAAAFCLALILPAAPVQVRAEQADTPALVKAYNRSGQELMRSFAGTPGNIVFSPYSIGSAMAMVLSGARGETQDEMHRALRHTLPPAGIDAANATALTSLLAYNDGTAKCPPGFSLKDKRCEAKAPEARDGDCPFDAKREGERCVLDARVASAKLRIANALMLVNATATVAPAFEAAMKNGYFAEIFRGANLDTVNGWVKDKTEGKIDTILERLNPNDSHVLLNAVYFNAPWANAFPASATRDRDFTLANGEEISVPTMMQQRDFAVVKGEGYAAIRLPYAVDGLSMTIVRPDDAKGLDALIAAFDGEKTEGLLQSLRQAPKRTVALSMPRFRTAFEADLIEPFKSVGMTRVFNSGEADLSGMTGKPRNEQQSAIDKIVHRAVIEVAEEGTEAAAVTAVVVTTRTMAPSKVETFDVDRPFLFMITDDRTGAILFEGRISDPR